MLAIELIFYIAVFIFGSMIGSFLNVVIRRLPLGEGIAWGRSYCPHCHHTLAAWQLIPLISYLILKGKCHYCQSSIGRNYPGLEFVNGLLYLVIICFFGFNYFAIIGCFLGSALLALAIIDAKTGLIPPAINIFIGLLALINLGFNLAAWPQHLAGFIIISGFLCLLFWLSKGRVIGGGDIKLMAAVGLLLGLKLSLLAFFLACVLGAIIHIIRMRFFGAGRNLAFGPYLAAAILITYFVGDALIAWYLDFIF